LRAIKNKKKNKKQTEEEKTKLGEGRKLHLRRGGAKPTIARKRGAVNKTEPEKLKNGIMLFLGGSTRDGLARYGRGHNKDNNKKNSGIF